MDTRGTWTGFVDLNGKSRLVIALEVARDDDGVVTPIFPEASIFLRKIKELTGFQKLDLDQSPNGDLFLLVMLP